jgi:hypothetical protein
MQQGATELSVFIDPTYLPDPLRLTANFPTLLLIYDNLISELVHNYECRYLRRALLALWPEEISRKFQFQTIGSYQILCGMVCAGLKDRLYTHLRICTNLDVRFGG